MPRPITVLPIFILSLLFAGCTGQSAVSGPTPVAGGTAVSTARSSVPAAASSSATPSKSDTPNPPNANGNSKEVTVFAAATLTDPFNDVAAAFTSQTGTKVVFSFGPSNQLRAQIEQGAPADVFASADQANMDAMVSKGEILSSPQVFARNRLVVIVPKSNPGKIEQLQDIARDGIKFVSEAPDMPAGMYWMQVLGKMSADPAFGSSFKDKVMKNFISQDTDIKQGIAKIQLGEGDAGIAFISDVTPKVAPDVKIIEIPDALNVVATYPIGVIKDAKESESGQAFVSFVLSKDGQTILDKYHFMPAK